MALEQIQLSEVILGPFEGLPPSPNQTKGAHWSKLHSTKQEWQQLVGYAALAHRRTIGSPWAKAQVHYTINVGDNRRHDPDNLLASVCKPTLDGMTGIIIADDSIDNIELSFTFTRDKPRGFTIRVTKV